MAKKIRILFEGILVAALFALMCYTSDGKELLTLFLTFGVAAVLAIIELSSK